jgi:hypothetical protein
VLVFCIESVPGRGACSGFLGDKSLDVAIAAWPSSSSPSPVARAPFSTVLLSRLGRGRHHPRRLEHQPEAEPAGAAKGSKHGRRRGDRRRGGG